MVIKTLGTSKISSLIKIRISSVYRVLKAHLNFKGSVTSLLYTPHSCIRGLYQGWCIGMVPLGGVSTSLTTHYNIARDILGVSLFCKYHFCVYQEISQEIADDCSSIFIRFSGWDPLPHAIACNLKYKPRNMVSRGNPKRVYGIVTICPKVVWKTRIITFINSTAVIRKGGKIKSYW